MILSEGRTRFLYLQQNKADHTVPGRLPFETLMFRLWHSSPRAQNCPCCVYRVKILSITQIMFPMHAHIFGYEDACNHAHSLMFRHACMYVQMNGKTLNRVDTMVKKSHNTQTRQIYIESKYEFIYRCIYLSVSAAPVGILEMYESIFILK